MIRKFTWITGGTDFVLLSWQKTKPIPTDCLVWVCGVPTQVAINNLHKDGHFRRISSSLSSFCELSLCCIRVTLCYFLLLDSDRNHPSAKNMSHGAPYMLEEYNDTIMIMKGALMLEFDSDMLKVDASSLQEKNPNGNRNKFLFFLTISVIITE
jgi:hypothetical protein